MTSIEHHRHGKTPVTSAFTTAPVGLLLQKLRWKTCGGSTSVEPCVHGNENHEIRYSYTSSRYRDDAQSDIDSDCYTRPRTEGETRGF